MITRTVLIMTNGKYIINLSTEFNEAEQKLLIRIARYLYEKLDEKYNFKMGNILVATKTKQKLLDTIFWIQFNKMEKQLEDCLNSDNCSAIKEIIDSLNNEFEVSNHPVHIINSAGELREAALVI